MGSLSKASTSHGKDEVLDQAGAEPSANGPVWKRHAWHEGLSRVSGMGRVSKRRGMDGGIKSWGQSSVGWRLDWTRNHQLEQAVEEGEETCLSVGWVSIVPLPRFCQVWHPSLLVMWQARAHCP